MSSRSVRRLAPIAMSCVVAACSASPDPEPVGSGGIESDESESSPPEETASKTEFTGDTAPDVVQLVLEDSPPLVRLEERYGCALDLEGEVFCWGNDLNELGGLSNTGHSDTFDVYEDTDTSLVTAVPSGQFELLATYSEQCAMVFEAGGTGGMDWVCGDYLLELLAQPVLDIDGHRESLCAVYEDGTLFCRSQLNFQLPSDSDFAFVANGRAGICAIRVDGSWWCGERRIPNRDLNRGTLAVEHPIIRYVAMSHTNDGLCVVTEERTVACHDVSSDIAIPNVTTATKVAVDKHCVCVLLENGTVDCGCDTPEKEAEMAAVEDEQDIADLDLWDRLCVSYATDGSVKCFGGDDRWGRSSPGDPPGEAASVAARPDEALSSGGSWWARWRPEWVTRLVSRW